MFIIEKCLALYGSEDFYVKFPARDVPPDYWTQKADPDGKIRDITAERHLRMQDVAYIAEFVNQLPSGRVLDVGCGHGELLEQIDKRHNRIGVDTSNIAIEALAALEGVLGFKGQLSDINLEPDSCDAVLSHHVIEHIADPIGFVKETAKLLKPGGSFVCGTPNFASPAARIFGNRFRLLHDPTHISLFTDDSLIRLLRHEGFRITRVDYPFFETRYATLQACEQMLEGTADVSPAFWGSFVTVFAEKIGKS